MPVTEPPLKATSSAGGTPPRAASATRAFARTERFIPMNPAAPESTPPITNPTATVTLWIATRTITIGIATAAMIVYCRVR